MIHRVEVRVPVEDLAEIDAARGETTRTDFMIAASLARARGRLEVPEALAVVREALERAGEL